MFNAVCKIPMQFSILMLGVLLFVFYQFEPAPLFFNPAARQALAASGSGGQAVAWEGAYQTAHLQVRQQLENWLAARHGGDRRAEQNAFAAATLAQRESEAVRSRARDALAASQEGPAGNDADYVFITFILQQLPHGVIGLLVAAFFAATFSSKAAELNALSSSTTIDFYRHLIRRDASDATCVAASKWFTVLWGLVAIGFALCAHLAENLIQAVNILGSIFYGVMLGLFLVAFFVKSVGGTAVFWGALAAQTLIFVLFAKLTISYLWYPLIGCAACVGFSLIIQTTRGAKA
jgi:Na+(H+)/acetate symporter ActP